MSEGHRNREKQPCGDFFKTVPLDTKDLPSARSRIRVAGARGVLEDVHTILTVERHTEDSGKSCGHRFDLATGRDLQNY